MRLFEIVLETLFASALLIAAASADRVKIRDGWIVPVTNLASIQFAKDGVAKHNGHSYVMEPVRFQGSPQMMTALATGELEVCLRGYADVRLQWPASLLPEQVGANPIHDRSR